MTPRQARLARDTVWEMWTTGQITRVRADEMFRQISYAEEGNADSDASAVESDTQSQQES